MTKDALEIKLEALKQLVGDKALEQQKYQAQILDLEQQLKDINKPRLTPLQFDELREAVEEAVGQFDFDDADNYDMDFHIDYDNRIAVESMSFQNADEIVREVYNQIEELFAELPEDELSIQEHLNQD